jgi:elongation factor Ts
MWMAISADMVKGLRQKTGCGIMECKQALQETGGDLETAVEALRKKGLKTAAKKAGRATSEGQVGAYIHPGGEIGVLIEINCETDFVARTEDFQQLVKDICMQIAASSPQYVRREDVPQEVIEKEKEIYQAQLAESGKPENIIDKIVQGKLEKGFFAQYCLLDQPFIRDDKLTVGQLVTEKIAKLGENLNISRFSRFQLGEGSE